MDTPNPIRKYLFDVAKIVEGALRSDQEKVLAYATQLRDRFAGDGLMDAAKRIAQLLERRQAGMAAVARVPGTAESLGLPVDGESRLPMADIEVCEPSDTQVFLPSSIRETVDRFLRFVQEADRLIANGVGVSASMLIYGPPGCGKTQLARHIAARLDLPLITARTDTLISSYLGSTSKNIRALFAHAAARPCVLFLDEFDALGKMRDDSRELGELKRVVISLLQNIDAMSGEHVLLAATNHEHLLDSAIWRRFAHRVQVPYPEAEARHQVIARVLGEFGTEELVFLLVALTAGFSGADCQDLAEEAVRLAVVNHQPTVSPTHLAESILTRRTPAGTTVCSIKDKVHLLRQILPAETTQSQIAMLLGISQAQVSKLLKGGLPHGDE